MKGTKTKQELKSAIDSAHAEAFALNGWKLSRGAENKQLLKTELLDGTALITATNQDKPGLVLRLLQNGARVDAQCTINGKTALMYAVSRSPGSISLLLDHNASVHATDKDGRTALMYAALDDHPESISILLRHGAHVDAKDKEGMTALMYAAWWSNLESTRILLENGADLHATDHEGSTVLMYAIQNHPKLEIIDMLIARGAQIDCKILQYGWEAYAEDKNPKIGSKRLDTILNIILSKSENGGIDIIADCFRAIQERGWKTDPRQQATAKSKKDLFKGFIFNLIKQKHKSSEETLITILRSKTSQTSFAFWAWIYERYIRKDPQKLQSVKKGATRRWTKKEFRQDYEVLKGRQSGAEMDFRKQLVARVDDDYVQALKRLNVPNTYSITHLGIPVNPVLVQYEPVASSSTGFEPPPPRYRFVSIEDIPGQSRQWNLNREFMPIAQQAMAAYNERRAPPQRAQTFDLVPYFLHRYSILREFVANLPLDIPSHESAQYEADIDHYLTELNDEIDTWIFWKQQPQQRQQQQRQLPQRQQQQRQDPFLYTGHADFLWKTRKEPIQGAQGKQKQIKLTPQQLHQYNQQTKHRKEYNGHLLKTEFRPILDDIFRIVGSKKYHPIAIVDVNNWGFARGVRHFEARNRLDHDHTSALIAEIRADPAYATLPQDVFWVFVGQKNDRGIEMMYQDGDDRIVIRAGCVYMDRQHGRQKECVTHHLKMNPVDDMIIKNLGEYLKRQLQKAEDSLREREREKGTADTTIEKKIKKMRLKRIIRYVGNDLYRDLVIPS